MITMSEEKTKSDMVIVADAINNLAKAIRYVGKCIASGQTGRKRCKRGS